jgi:hypothetical protein
MALLTQVLSDTLSISSDAAFVETHFSSDNLNISDAISVSKTCGVLLADAVSASDVVTKGFLRWTSPSDSVAAADQLNLSGVFAKLSADSLAVGDTIHTWKGSDSILIATLEGSADLRAVLEKKKAPAIPVGAPPRTVILPKPPTVPAEHCVVNPNPPRNREG